MRVVCEESTHRTARLGCRSGVDHGLDGRPRPCLSERGLEVALKMGKSLSARRFWNPHSRSMPGKLRPSVRKFPASVQAAGRVRFGGNWGACIGGGWILPGRRAAVDLRRVPIAVGKRSDGWLGGQRRRKRPRRHRLERRSTVVRHGRGKLKTDDYWGDHEGVLRGTL